MFLFYYFFTTKTTARITELKYCSQKIKYWYILRILKNWNIYNEYLRQMKRNIHLIVKKYFLEEHATLKFDVEIKITIAFIMQFSAILTVKLNYTHNKQ